MATGYKVAGGADLDALFMPGSAAHVPVGYKVAGGADLSMVFHPYTTGALAPATGYTIAGGADLNTRFQNINVPLVTNHTVSISVISGNPNCSYDPNFPALQSSCTATETLFASVSNGVGPFTYLWTEIADASAKYSFPGSTSSSTCAVRSVAGDGVWGATVRCTVTDTGNGNYQTVTDYVLSHTHTAI